MNEGMITAATVLMDQLGNHPLAYSGIAEQQDGGTCGRYRLDLLKYLLHQQALGPDHLKGLRFPEEAVFQFVHAETLKEDSLKNT